MTMMETLVKEFEHEVKTTRRHLERVPGDRWEWRPHEKSSTVGALASHIADCVRWGDAIFAGDAYDLDPATFRPYQATSVTDLLATFDADVATCKAAMGRAEDDSLSQAWRLTMRGRVRVERPKVEAFRDFTLSHLIHHRGQLSVYLRLLGVPVPGSYGPTADEQG